MKYFDTITNPALVTLLLGGGVVCMPTDTVYGLVACADNARAIAKLYELKTRQRKPGTLIAANVTQLQQLGFAETELAIAEQYWPAPLSIILDATNVPEYLRADLSALAVRIPDHSELRQLLGWTGALMTTSANPHNLATATDIASAQAYFGNRLDAYVDGGAIIDHQPSTIARIEQSKLIVIRPGAATI